MVTGFRAGSEEVRLREKWPLLDSRGLEFVVVKLVCHPSYVVIASPSEIGQRPDEREWELRGCHENASFPLKSTKTQKWAAN